MILSCQARRAQQHSDVSSDCGSIQVRALLSAVGNFLSWPPTAPLLTSQLGLGGQIQQQQQQKHQQQQAEAQLEPGPIKS